jgi:hypothetical protein
MTKKLNLRRTPNSVPGGFITDTDGNNLPARGVAEIEFTVGAENAGAGTINVVLQAKDAYDRDLDHAIRLPWYLSSDSAGQAIATAHSGGCAIGTDGFLTEWTANLSGMLTFEADGDADITFTEAGALTTYLVIVLPDGRLQISGAITHA